MKSLLSWGFGLVLLLLLAAGASAENWPAWRGPRGDGSSLEKTMPIAWSAQSNVLWKTSIPGAGHASPIVWEDRLFLVSALPESQDRVLICLEREKGRILWQQTALTAPLERKHGLNSSASSTPATDGQRVYVTFLDRDQILVAAYDFGGQRQWVVRPGAFSSMHGFCSSPILYQDLVIVNGDHDGESYLVALRRSDGATVWKTPRQNHTRSYCAPLIKTLAGKPQMVLAGDKCVASYDPATGKQHWVIDGPTEQFVASPVFNERAGLLFVTGGFPDHHILAINPDGAGNVTETKILWRTTKGVSYVPSPISERDYFLVVSDTGVAHCFEAKTGRIVWAEKTGEQHASLVSAGGFVYCLNDKGECRVVRPGATYEQIALNELGEKCFASPALSQGRIYLRSFNNLYCVSGAVGKE